jgi:hypothetical protein
MFFEPSHPDGLTMFDLFSDTRSVIAGLSVNVLLGKGLSLEANALHRNLHLKRRFIFPDGSTLDQGRTSVSTWQWPILLKYRLPAHRRIQPFVEAGPSFRTRHNPVPSEPSQFGGTICRSAAPKPTSFTSKTMRQGDSARNHASRPTGAIGALIGPAVDDLVRRCDEQIASTTRNHLHSERCW